MGYLINSGTGFLSNAVTVASDLKSYLVNKTGYLVDAIKVGIGDFGQRVLDDSGTVEASAEAAASYREITKEIYDQASLVLFPSGYKDNLLYSHKPVNGSGDFTYTRGTDTATRVGADGYIKKERANLLEQSNQFDTTWIVNTSVSEGEEGYDGTNDAWSLTRAAGGSLMARQENVTLSGVSTYSIYAKINTNNGIGLAFNGLSTAARFDIRDATKTQAVTETGIISSSQKYVGNGFYRLSITADVSGSTQLRIYLTTADATTSDSNGGTHIIQDAQVEQGLVANSYIETTTAPVYEGLTDNLPRIDYTGGTPSILLEPSRTNLIGQSEYFGGYSNSNSTDEPNATTSPEGLTNATSFLEAATTGQHKLTTSLSFDGSSAYTFSIFAKTNGRDLYIDTQNSNEWGGRAWFDLTNGTANAVLGTANIEDFGNGWYRCIVTGASTLAGGNLVELLTSDGSTNSTTGDITKGVFIYGAQLEQGSYPTSYIPTYNASATRAADNSTLSSIINGDAAFTFMIESGIQDYGSSVPKYFDAGALGYINHNTSNILRYRFGGSNYVQSISGLHSFKFLLRYDGSEIKVYFNGLPEHTISASLSGSIGLSLLGGLNKKVLLFPTALSDDDCEALTTP